MVITGLDVQALIRGTVLRAPRVLLGSTGMAALETVSGPVSFSS